MTQAKNITCPAAPKFFLCSYRLGERGCWSCQALQRARFASPGSPAKGRGVGGRGWGAEDCEV